MSRKPSFRLQCRPEEFCLVYLGAALTLGEIEDGETEANDPYLLLRRSFDGGQTVAALRVEWEGVFTLLSNDDERAEALFAEMLAGTEPEEVVRQWTDDPDTLQMMVEMLQAS